MLNVCTVIGARPQFIKAAAVSREIARVNRSGATRLAEAIIHTGQHFDQEMSDVFFRDLGIPQPAVNLGLGGIGPPEAVGAMLPALGRELTARRPDVVVVYGDTSTTLAAALAAAYAGIPLCHVEAGVRSFNRAMPEEINRTVTDRLASLLCCPTRRAVQNLAAEGITKGVVLTGDVMRDQYEAVRPHLDAAPAFAMAGGLKSGSYVALTLHRAENTDDPEILRTLLDYVRKTAKDAAVLFPMHPRTRKALAAAGLSTDGFRILDPLGYVDMLSLIKGARSVFTDSGGVQKEAYFLNVPCVTLRNETEWPETIECGWNRLWRTEAYLPRRPIEDLSRPGASDRIVQALLGAFWAGAADSRGGAGRSS